MNCKEKKKRASFSLRRTISPLQRHMNRHAVFYMQAPFVFLFLLFIIIPLVYLFFKFLKARRTEEYHHISSLTKVVMLAGILSLLFFKIYM